MDTHEIEHRFAYHPPTTDDIAKSHEIIREIMRNTARTVNKLVPDSREKSLAVTHLEEAMYWSNAGIARVSNYEESPV